MAAASGGASARPCRTHQIPALPATPGRQHRKRDCHASSPPSSVMSDASFSDVESCMEDEAIPLTSGRDDTDDGFIPVTADTVVSWGSRTSSKNAANGHRVLFRPTDKTSVRALSRPHLNALFGSVASQQVKEIRVNGRKNLIAVDVLTEEAVPALLQIQKIGETPVDARVPWRVRHTAGVVRDVDQALTDKEILEALRAPAHQVLDVRRLGKSSAVRVTFAGKDLPHYVHMGYVRHPVTLYVARPLQCFRCNRIGHVAAACQKEQTCAKCSGGHESTACDSETSRCINCGKGHAATSGQCPVLRKERRVCKMRARMAYTHEQNTGKGHRNDAQAADTERRKMRSQQRLSLTDFPPLPGSQTEGREKRRDHDTTHPPKKKHSRGLHPDDTTLEDKGRRYANVARKAQDKAPATMETADVALLRMVSRLFRAVRQLAQARGHTPEAKFALEVLDAVSESLEAIAPQSA
ncbi:hypothetical protein HPB47_013899 [Ixodes persulcatus]|uniref:Uncharacterized protein n=1 Tax=Ixodes persulcatus TaxID=34615 RepID=A0AC60QXD4_IXOPE|nr:hypothetical protein HPB47_013899 [Ixodes persulcatus]